MHTRTHPHIELSGNGGNRIKKKRIRASQEKKQDTVKEGSKKEKRKRFFLLNSFRLLCGFSPQGIKQLSSNWTRDEWRDTFKKRETERNVKFIIIIF